MAPSETAAEATVAVLPSLLVVVAVAVVIVAVAALPSLGPILPQLGA